jgi:predicted alpha/beta-fold hydrolase
MTKEASQPIIAAMKSPHSLIENWRKLLAQEAFRPATGLRGGHLQTLSGHFLPNGSLHLPTPEPIELPVPRRAEIASSPREASDTLVGEIYGQHLASRQGVLHIFHGLAGCTESTYMPRAAAAALGEGWVAVLWNHRGCGAGRKKSQEPYHSGRSDDLARAIGWSRQRFPHLSTHALLGYSLSANATCLTAAGIVPSNVKSSTAELSPSDVQKSWEVAGLDEQNLPDAAIAFNPPTDLSRAARRLSAEASRVYGQRFMLPLIECLEDRRELGDALAEQALVTLRPWSTVAEFDALYTGPAGGFGSASQYYERASSRHAFGRLQRPLLLITAEDDPITAGLRDLSSREQERLQADRHLAVVSHASGGHMGFVDAPTLGTPVTGTLRWMDRMLALALREIVRTHPRPTAN